MMLQHEKYHHLNAKESTTLDLTKENDPKGDGLVHTILPHTVHYYYGCIVRRWWMAPEEIRLAYKK
jgi:hypothetical protein